MSELTVSVVVTTYNRARLVPRAIDSALAQRYPEDRREIIVVDDGSTDGTREALSALYGEQIRYFYKPNGGMNSASQFGIERARGELIALLDSDDYWYEEKLARCVPLFAQSADVVAVIHDLDRVLAASGAKLSTFWGSSDVYFDSVPRDALQHYLAGGAVRATTSGLLLRREAALKTLPFPDGLRSFHDAYFARNIIFYGKVCAAREALGAYVIHDANDYGFKPSRELTDERLEQSILETRLLSESFNRRCEQFGMPSSSPRSRIQNFARASIALEKYRRRGYTRALRSLIRNDFALGLRERMHLLTRLTLPPRAAAFVCNRILIGRAPID